MPSSVTRGTGEWPAWIDDVLAYEPIAELEMEWRTAIAEAIVRVLDVRAGTRSAVSYCDKHGMILVLSCTACAREEWRRSWWRRIFGG